MNDPRNYHYFLVYPHEMYDAKWNGSSKEKHPYLREKFLKSMEELHIEKICWGAARMFRCNTGPAIGNLNKLQYRFWGDTDKFEIKNYDYEAEMEKFFKRREAKMLGTIEPHNFRAVSWQPCCRRCLNCYVFDDGSGACGVNNGFEIDNVDEAISDDFIRRD